MPALQSVVYGAADGQRTGAGPGGDGFRRAILVAAVGPLVAGYAGIAVVLALVTATAHGTTFSVPGVLLAAGPVWLAGYHVPVDITGHELGVLPLLLTALLLALVARSAGNAARRIDLAGPRPAARVIVPIAAVHAVFAVLIALLCSAGPLSVSPVLAFFVAGMLAAVAATIGVARPCGLVEIALSRADHATETGLRAGVLAVGGLVAVSTVVFAVGLITSWSTSAHLFRIAAPGVGSGLGMLLLSVAYLPNALIGTLSFTTGPGFGIGTVSIAQWRFHGGPLPAVPLLAPLPAAVGPWWIFLMLLPAGVGVLVGRACRGVTDGRLRAVLVAALAAGVSWLVLAALAGGALAGGPFDPVTVPAGSLGVSVFLFVAIPGALTVWLTGRGQNLLAADDFEDDDPDDEEPADDVETEPDEQ
ncbi:MAG TPA: DUF6350 family protein [Pseudonocardiaceae bacterium]|nr:DUF6350 family protein [Pseudonocardiaceae bacterium]